MFGVVLAIGLLVDDAIVVVENVERVMTEEGLPPKEATRKSMDQITGALIGIGLVLAAVFVPMAFFGGSTGVIYRQFSVTIVAAMGLSVLVALVFTPALCATMLKPIDASRTEPRRPIAFHCWLGGRRCATSAASAAPSGAWAGFRRLRRPAAECLFCGGGCPPASSRRRTRAR
jgi:multidrug efflux pump subunit AcrB